MMIAKSWKGEGFFAGSGLVISVAGTEDRVVFGNGRVVRLSGEIR
jgi:hypothetical protein